MSLLRLFLSSLLAWSMPFEFCQTVHKVIFPIEFIHNHNARRDQIVSGRLIR